MKTLVIGASEHEVRYSNKAIKMLREYDHEVVALGLRAGKVLDVAIDSERKSYQEIHTVTLYINPKIQKEYYNYIIDLNPKRVIFNPGTENPDFYELLIDKEIEVLEACTLVLLRSDQYNT